MLGHLKSPNGTWSVPFHTITVRRRIGAWPSVELTLGQSPLTPMELAPALIAGASLHIQLDKEPWIPGDWTLPDCPVTQSAKRERLPDVRLVNYEAEGNQITQLHLALAEVLDYWHHPLQEGNLVQVPTPYNQDFWQPLFDLNPWIMQEPVYDQAIKARLVPLQVLIQHPGWNTERSLAAVMEALTAGGRWTDWTGQVVNVNGVNQWRACLRFDDPDVVARVSLQGLSGFEFIGTHTSASSGRLRADMDSDRPAKDWIACFLMGKLGKMQSSWQWTDQLPGPLAWTGPLVQDGDEPPDNPAWMLVDEMTLRLQRIGDAHYSTLRGELTLSLRPLVKPVATFAAGYLLQVKVGAWDENSPELRKVIPLPPYAEAKKKPLLAQTLVPGFSRKGEAGLYPVFQQGQEDDRVALWVRSGAPPTILGAWQQRRDALEGLHGVVLQTSGGIHLVPGSGEESGSEPPKTRLSIKGGERLTLEAPADQLQLTVAGSQGELQIASKKTVLSEQVEITQDTTQVKNTLKVGDVVEITSGTTTVKNTLEVGQ